MLDWSVGQLAKIVAQREANAKLDDMLTHTMRTKIEDTKLRTAVRASHSACDMECPHCGFEFRITTS